MTAVLSLTVLVISIIIHELAHGYAADSLGDPTARLAGRLTMNPLPHIDPMGSVILPALLVFTNSPILFGWARPVPYNPFNLRNKRWGEAFVAVAGSATNILLAVIFGLVLRYGHSLGLDPAALSLAAIISFVNLFLGLFNLIPVPPLDGFTTLRAVLPWHMASSLTNLEARVRSGGVMSLILFLLLFSIFLSGPFFSFITYIFSYLTGMSLSSV